MWTLSRSRAYTISMSTMVGVRELRNNLRTILERVEAGEEVIVTARGRPVARIAPVGRRTTLERLIAEGIVTPSREPEKPIELEELIPIRGGLTDILLEERRAC